MLNACDAERVGGNPLNQVDIHRLMRSSRGKGPPLRSRFLNRDRRPHVHGGPCCATPRAPDRPRGVEPLSVCTFCGMTATKSMGTKPVSQIGTTARTYTDGEPGGGRGHRISSAPRVPSSEGVPPYTDAAPPVPVTPGSVGRIGLSPTFGTASNETSMPARSREPACRCLSAVMCSLPVADPCS